MWKKKNENWVGRWSFGFWCAGSLKVAKMKIWYVSVRNSRFSGTVGWEATSPHASAMSIFRTMDRRKDLLLFVAPEPALRQDGETERVEASQLQSKAYCRNPFRSPAKSFGRCTDMLSASENLLSNQIARKNSPASGPFAHRWIVSCTLRIAWFEFSLKKRTPAEWMQGKFEEGKTFSWTLLRDYEDLIFAFFSSVFNRL